MEILRRNSHILFLLVFLSCDSKKYPTIPLNSLEPKLEIKSNTIVKGILKSFKVSEGADYLTHKRYCTPLVHARIKTYPHYYKLSYKLINENLGNIESYRLFQVMDKGVVKGMRYRLKCSNDSLKFVELMIDVNLNYDLSDFYLYVTTKDESLKQFNLLPKATKPGSKILSN